MVWYYAEGDRQRGPISDEEFEELVRNGRIHNETLIWKDGMDTWQPLKTVWTGGPANAGPSVPISGGPPAAEGASTPAGSPAYPDLQTPSSTPVQPQTQSGSHCSQCGRGPLAPGEGVQLGNILFCRQCDADMARHYQQQAWQQAGAAPQAPQSATGWGGQAYNYAAQGALVFASIFSRAVAKFLDNLLQTVVVVVLMVSITDFGQMGLSFEDLASGSEDVMRMLRPWLLGSIVLAVLYDAILVGMFSATLGKMAMGIRVVSGDGTRVKASQAVIRAIAPAVLQLPGVLAPTSIFASVAQFVFLFGYLIAVMDPQRRTLYDHVANTRVVQ